ncbi:MAG: hypothetical protein KF861_18995 [Planctomycetaceae bacterium]|nr:hypothetical protein [Planctomycetaceae bacterium]
MSHSSRGSSVNSSLTDFDALNWINRYFAGEAALDYSELRPVLSFSLIWNLFETIACRRSANATTIRRSVDHADQSGRLNRSKYHHYVEFFRERYLHDGRIDDVFDRLLMTDRESQNMMRRVLVDDTKDLNNIVYALLLIAHRVRNNLFHGNKSVSSLHQQTELFQVINRLLTDYIEDIAPDRPPGLIRNRATK